MTMTNKIKYYIFVFSIIILATSCGSNSNIDICDVDGMKNLGEKILGELEDGAKVSRIEIRKDPKDKEEKLTTRFSKINIHYKNAEDKSKVLTVNLPDGKYETSDLKTPIIVGESLRELTANDFVKMAENVNKAIAEMKKNDINICGANLYTISLSPTPEYESYIFRLYEKDEDKSSFNTTYYNEYSCSMDGNGNINKLQP